LSEISPARPDVTRLLLRGTARHLASLGYGVVAEMPLPNGLRADLVGLSATGEILIVEIKSCLEDYRADRKWQIYRDYCDRLFFAVASDFPDHILPDDSGLIIADAYGGDLLRKGPPFPLAAARRKAMMIAFARLAARRLQMQIDPGTSSSTWLV
jgi:hypothetical protein